MGFFERYFIEKLKTKAIRDPKIKKIIDEYNSTPAIPSDLDERLEREFKEIRENAQREVDREWPERRKILYAEAGLDEYGRRIEYDDNTGERYLIDYSTTPATYIYPPGFKGKKHNEIKDEKVNVSTDTNNKDGPILTQETTISDVVNGLIQLGWKKPMANKLVRELARASPTQLTAEELMSLALKNYKK